MFVLGAGNLLTTSWTIPSKIIQRRKGMLKMRFTRLDKYFWSHRRRRDSASAKGASKRYSEDLKQILERTRGISENRVRAVFLTRAAEELLLKRAELLLLLL